MDQERPTLKCDGCGGSGIVGEEHQLGLVEPLGCPDCRGTGDTGLFADAVLALLRFNGYRLYRPDDHIVGQIDSVRFDTPGQDIIHLRAPSQMWEEAAMDLLYALVPAEGTP